MVVVIIIIIIIVLLFIKFRYISYVDETYIHSGHTQGKQWTDSSDKGFHKNISKGQRLIVVHGGGSNGFVENALLIFKSDEIITKAGHTVLRLPPYHPDLNPIEMIWGAVKNAIASRNVTGKKESVN